MRGALAFLLVTLMVGSGCLESNAPPSDDVDQTDDVPFRSLASGRHSGHDATQRVITDESAWRAFWDAHASIESPQPPLPQVDFASERVVAIVLEDKPSGCFGVEVRNVTRAGEDVEVRFTAYAPPPDVACPAVVTQPFHFVAIPSGGPVSFLRSEATAPAPQGGARSVRTLATGSHSGVEGGAREVIESVEAWRAFWVRHESVREPSEPLPEVDFERERVVAVVLDARPNACYAVRVADVVETEDATAVEVIEYLPPGDMICADVVTQPFHFVAIPAGSQVAFEEHDEPGPPPAE